jgi:hypothetical protein
MKITIGKRTLVQTTDGITADDIRFMDIKTKEVFDFDGYMDLIKNEKR